jgi:MFS family permease
MLAAGVCGAGLMIYNVNQQAIRGAVTPNRLLGRANAAVYVSVVGGRVVFALAGGLLGQAIGLRATFIAASVLGALSAIPALMPSLRTLREVPKAD